MEFTVGQRWISETEPELGLGILEEAGRHRIRLGFPASGETRLYAPASAPITRVRFHPGDSVHAADGEPLVIEEVVERDGLITYRGDGRSLAETALADSISFSKPEDRLAGGQADPSAVFALRYEANCRLSRARKSPVAGFIGGRIDLIPHQLYIASEVANRYLPRVLLADEVGLGKTIEACLVLHRLHLTGRAGRILILVPESLVHQWFVELLRRFNLWFKLLDAETCESVANGEAGRNPFLEEQQVICSTGFLARSERWARCAVEAGWDMLVVDEAHHLEWSPKQVSREYRLVEALTRQSEGLLLLTATPEQLGEAGHFARLRLLDPDRYPSLKSFKKEQRDYSRVAALAETLISGARLGRAESTLLAETLVELDADEVRERLDAIAAGDLAARGEVLAELVDRHGPGRVIFRNTREALSGFPERRALPAAAKPRATLPPDQLQERLLKEFDLETDPSRQPHDFDYRHGPRIRWLAELLRDLGDEKVLLICRTTEKVLALHRALGEEMKVNAAIFHEGLTLVQRDRNAAWFAEPDGARILICSEIGSEGRNFQFAHHLVLFDLPLDPELLEQRIGRLDRIGQTETIKVHMPYLRGSCTELLMRWHHEGLNGVEHSLRGGNAYAERFGARIRELGFAYHRGDGPVHAAADRLIAESRAFRERLEDRLRRGQDRLIALNSYRADVAGELIAQIESVDGNPELDAFMNRIFDNFGVTVEDLERRTCRLSPGQLFTDAFPALPAEGATVTFDRRVALGREDIQFLTDDHPMVRGSIDLILATERGNSAIVSVADEDGDGPGFLVEAVFILECVAPPRLHVDRFLPPTPLRIVVDVAGRDCSEAWPHKRVNAAGRDEEAFRTRHDGEALRDALRGMLRAATERADRRKGAVIEAALAGAHEQLDHEAARLRELQRINPSVRDEEIALAEHFVRDVAEHIRAAHLRLDAVRLIVRRPAGG